MNVIIVDAILINKLAMLHFKEWGQLIFRRIVETLPVIIWFYPVHRNLFYDKLFERLQLISRLPLAYCLLPFAYYPFPFDSENSSEHHDEKHFRLPCISFYHSVWF